MTIRADIDIVLCPKATAMTEDGVTTASIVATHSRIFLIPHRVMAGAGNTLETTTYTIGGEPPLHAIQRWMSDPQMNLADVESKLTKIMTEDWKLPITANPKNLTSDLIIELGSCVEFKVKAGFFSKGVYYKKAGQRGFRGFSVSGKDRALALQKYYPNAG